MRRLALISSIYPTTDQASLRNDRIFAPILRELRRLGYVEGDNIAIEFFSVDGQVERYDAVVAAVVRSKPDVIYTGLNDVLSKLKEATRDIPIVAAVNDPIAFGHVASLSRPEGNITGIALDAGVGFLEKRLQLLKELVPGLSRVGFLAPRSAAGRYAQATREAAERLGLSLTEAYLSSPATDESLVQAFAALVSDKVQAIIQGAGRELYVRRKALVRLAEEARLPAVYGFPDAVRDGGLIAYVQFDEEESGVRIADYIDRILKGASPGDLPIHQPTKIRILINLKAARANGSEVPPTLLARADEVIE